ncbi:MAG TPA: hypothetical protein VGP85_16235 [Pyrinomonadaceae bacterium]|jgi:hypothetical protein|nr:hypothetical protein [Pyrinomonadaceae bacterium]
MILRKLPHLLMIATVTLCLTPIIVESAPQVEARQARPQGNHLVEEFSFSIKDFKVDHQGQNNLNISVKYSYRANMAVSDYPDFRLIAKDIEMFLTNYPNETDYWEIVNKKITALILKKYSTLVSVTSQIEVSPTPTIPYLRSSITTRRRIAHGRSTIGK